MMKISFVQFLNYTEIFKLAVSNKKLFQILYRGNHLKIVCAIQELDFIECFDNQEIDRTFGVSIQKISDLQFMNGKIFKDSVRKILSRTPDLSNFTNGRKVQKNWQEMTREIGDILSCFRSQNKLSNFIDDIKYDYRSGGMFQIKRVVLKVYGKKHYNYWDFDMLIPSMTQEQRLLLKDFESK